jgi:hypothetical protein
VTGQWAPAGPPHDRGRRRVVLVGLGLRVATEPR